MKKVLVLYYSRSGNTEKMAKAVVEGAQSGSNITVELTYHIDDALDLANYDAVIMGVPTYRKEMPVDFKNLFEEAAAKNLSLKGRVGAVFGSYGWDPAAPTQVISIMQNQLGMTVIEPPLLAKYIPDETALEASRNLGKRVAETLKNQP